METQFVIVKLYKANIDHFDLMYTSSITQGVCQIETPFKRISPKLQLCIVQTSQPLIEDKMSHHGDIDCINKYDYTKHREEAAGLAIPDMLIDKCYSQLYHMTCNVMKHAKN